MPKHYKDKTVYDATVARMNYIYTHFNKIYVSFSGGKDSGVMLNLAIEAAKRHNKLPVHVLIIDLEAQYKHTIDYMLRMALRPEVKVFWVCLPLHLRNAVSQYQPHWLCWDESKRKAWVREYPEYPFVIKDPNYFPFFRKGMEFEEFVPQFGKWFGGGEDTACMVGIRSNESLNRFRAITNTKKGTYNGKEWSTKKADNLYNFYPIYDWLTSDIWVANGKFKFDYNKIYDLMRLAGLSIHQMRLCQPYGDDQKKGLYLFKILEPETWTKVVGRVEGANFGNRYSENDRHVMGNFKVNLPDGRTYESYAKFLLNTMPPYLKAHYEKKISTFIRYWEKHGFAIIPDKFDVTVEAKRKAPSWRRICKVLLKNDFWCTGLSFGQTKREMEKQLNMISKYMQP
ncbi:MAG: DUF3440 domain-containing protein [Bacteroidetes bacterium]|nr:DUF3440 domain-containing protein [Bacteroidota bacterium]